MFRWTKALVAAGAGLLVLASSVALPAGAQAATGGCSDETISRAQLQAASYVKTGSHMQAWSSAHAVGRCYGELSLFHGERLHYQEMYLAGVFCLLAYGAGKEDPKLINTDAGSLLLVNDLIYSATMLKSLADDDRAPRDLRSNARTILTRLLDSIHKAGAKLAVAQRVR